MKTTARSLISASIGFGLLTATVISAVLSSAIAPVTTLLFSLLVLYGVVEIAILSYTQPTRVLGARDLPKRVPTVRLHTASVVAFPAGIESRRAA